MLQHSSLMKMFLSLVLVHFLYWQNMLVLVLSNVVKNSDNNNVLAFGSCVRPAVEGDTNSWKESKCKDLYHESWLDKYNIESGRGNSTFCCVI